MNLIFSYLQDYFRNTDKWLLFCCACFAGIFLTLNYRFGIETKWIYNLPTVGRRFLGFYIVYAIAFMVPALLLAFFHYKDVFCKTGFWALLLLAPAVFAFKVSFPSPLKWLAGAANDGWPKYYAIILNLPLRLVVTVTILWLFGLWQKNTASFWGLTTKNFNWQPYALMLLIMVPLIAFAATRPDFLQMYPKLKQVGFIDKLTSNPAPCKFLYELSYGSDFISVELFFRGFLIFAFVRYFGIDAVLPMAVFYCSIHFGKPLFECISSFFGGLLLGIIAYRTQSVLGGVMVHLGIAWLMELGGWLGNCWKK